MLYFKHSELVDKFHVSLKTVHNWIDAAKQGKLDLELHEHDGRTYIANRPANIETIEKLVSQGKKYRNNRFQKIITPTAKFYATYSRRQILDIISNITIHHEIPRQYNYLDGGAANWDNWVKRLAKDNTPNMLNNTIELVNANLESLDALLKGREKVNVIDVGVGNALPVRELLAHLTKSGVLNRYIAIDISKTMLDIAERNIREWFGNKVRFEGHIRDMGYERFDDLLVDDMLDDDAAKTTNLVLLLGSTPLNFRNSADVLKVVYGSMGESDILMYTCKPDTESSRSYFDFGPTSGYNGLSPNHKLVLDLLSIDESLYEVERGFDEQKRMRYIRIRFNTALRIKFEFENSKRDVDLEKGDTILLFRVWHQNVLEVISVFEDAGFVLLQSNMTKDRERLLTISGIDTKSDLGTPA